MWHNWGEIKRVCNYVENYTDYDVSMIWDNWNRYDRQKVYADFSIYELIDFCKICKTVYLYGKGIIGKKLMDFLNSEGLDDKARYVVTDNNGDTSVEQIDEIDRDQDIGIVIAVGRKLHEEVFSTAKKFFNENQIFRLYK